MYLNKHINKEGLIVKNITRPAVKHVFAHLKGVELSVPEFKSRQLF